jgi:uncharacterized protein (DUF302 family)
MVRSLLPAVAALLLTSAATLSQPLTIVESRFTFKETGDRLTSELEKRGIRIAARIDHAAGAKSVGLEMLPTEVIMFGHPRLGTPLMMAQPFVAIELPMKMLIWQDSAGKVMIGYTPASTLKDRYQISGQDEVFKTMEGALAGLAKIASQP